LCTSEFATISNTFIQFQENLQHNGNLQNLHEFGYNHNLHSLQVLAQIALYKHALKTVLRALEIEKAPGQQVSSRELCTGHAGRGRG
jgi:hypothetical protein